MTNPDVIIIGAGAAGLMCAIEAGKRGRRVRVFDHATKIGEKIRISGGGRCNFTNLHASKDDFISQNPRFAISALKRFSQHDFIKMVEGHGIAWHEKTLGQLFCDDSSSQILDMLLEESRKAAVTIRPETTIESIRKEGPRFILETSQGQQQAERLVIACGGKSIPKIGATGFGYQIAEQFGLNIIPPRPALVPLTFNDQTLQGLKPLAGISLNALVKHGKVSFEEGLLFTHRGLSGPSILQISSYWREGDEISINLLPHEDLFALLKEAKTSKPKQEIQTALSHYLPKKLTDWVLGQCAVTGRLADLSDKKLRMIADQVQHWRIKPAGTEGYRTAEVTAGGVDTKELSSKTMEANAVPGLYFIGEVVDVTGHLGGFNFQWAWSSGHACGQYV